MKKTIKIQAFLIVLIFLAASVFAGDLTWQQCADEALANNPGLLSARAKLDQSRANSWLAFSGALPQVSASGGGSKSGSEPLAGPYTSNESYSYSLRASQMVFDGLGTLQDMMASGENLKAAEMNYKISSASVRNKLMQAYSGLMKAQELVSITGEILDLRKKQLADIRLRYQAGREHKGSLMSVEADLKQAEFENSQALRAFELAKTGLANALGRDKADGISVKTDFSASVDPLLEPDFDKLYETNPGLLILIAQKNAAANAAGSAAGAFLPSVSVSAGVGRSAGNFPPENANWSLGVNVSLPLLDGGRLIAQSLAAQASLKQAEAGLKEGGWNTMQQLKQAWQDYKDAVETLNVQKSYMDANNERAKISDAQYRNGLLTFDSWTIIQNSLVSSRKGYLNAQANLLINEAAWIQAKGGTLEDEKK